MAAIETLVTELLVCGSYMLSRTLLSDTYVHLLKCQNRRQEAKTFTKTLFMTPECPQGVTPVSSRYCMQSLTQLPEKLQSVTIVKTRPEKWFMYVDMRSLKVMLIELVMYCEN